MNMNIKMMKVKLNLKKTTPDPAPPLVALAGNPNTGKSTIFNGLTGLKQHTGNWPGKTVVQTKGCYRHGDRTVNLVDLPGTYSLLAGSPEEQVARDFLCFAAPDATIVVADAGCLERHLNLVLQVMEITPKTILCVNLIDEAEKKKIRIDYEKLRTLLGSGGSGGGAEQKRPGYLKKYRRRSCRREKQNLSSFRYTTNRWKRPCKHWKKPATVSTAML